MGCRLISHFKVKINLEFICESESLLDVMKAEEIEHGFQEIRNELETCKQQIASLKEDLKILLKHRSIAHRDIIDTAHQLGNRAFDQSDVQKCREFLQRYNIRV
jgi:hypothetical protein